MTAGGGFAMLVATTGMAHLLFRWQIVSPRPPVFTEGSCILTAAFASVVATFAIQRWLVRRALWRHFGFLCSSCGYDLTANASGVCPECGRAVGRAEAEKVE